MKFFLASMVNYPLINVQYFTGRVILAGILSIADCHLTLPEQPHSCCFQPYLLLLEVNKLLVASGVAPYSIEYSVLYSY